jgi:hypothetical protein
MALDAFNSVGGYSVGIPPVQVIDSTGAITAPTAVIGNITIAGSAVIAGDTVIAGNVVANSYTGNLNGNVNGSIIAPGNNTDVMYNNNGVISGADGLNFNNLSNTFTVNGPVISTYSQLGIGANTIATTIGLIANTTTNATGQKLHQVSSFAVSSIDYTVIATDPVGNNRQTSKLIATVLGSEVGYLEFSTIDVPITSPGVGDFSVAYNLGYIQLLVDPLVNNLVNYKIHAVIYAN